jgi:D-3-phosphoglycerate dehydrogenase
MQTAYKVLRIDPVHPLLDEILKRNHIDVTENLTASYDEIARILPHFDGLVLRSRIPVDAHLISKGKRLKFIARVGSGLEGIDRSYAESKGIRVINAAEGNANAVGEMATGLLLALLRNINKAGREIKSGQWLRNANRGYELEGKTVSIIGYGNTGKAFARKLAGFDVNVLFYDIKPGLQDEYAREAAPDEIFEQTDILSLHVPLTELTRYMVNENYIDRFKKPFWLINTSRGEVVKTDDLVKALESGKIRGAALDVLEYENPAFGDMLLNKDIPGPLQYLLNHPRVILTPHIAGLTKESMEKLARITARKILDFLK